MKLLGRGLLTKFTKKHPDARGWVGNWVSDVECSVWKTSVDIKQRYASASFLKDNVVIFNVKGNSYRLEVGVAYKSETVIVKCIGTHAEYTKRYS